MATRALLAGEAYRQRVTKIDGSKSESGIVRSVLSMRKKLLRWNKATAAPVRLPDWLAAEISDTLADEVALLSTLIDRDLSHWLGGKAKQSSTEQAPQRAEAVIPHTG